MKRYIYPFTDPERDRLLLGNKGVGLCEMTALGLPVPKGFVISTKAAKESFTTQSNFWAEVKVSLEPLGTVPVSVRSGAPVSMPGMMDTVLNVQGFEAVREAVLAVWRSWDSPRAQFYRAAHGISRELHTAVVVQRMVLGDRDALSGTGVVFTRNPSTGERELYGEYLPQAQGDRLVGGSVTPSPLNYLDKDWLLHNCYYLLDEFGLRLEAYYRDMQEVEFTIESGKLWLLQTRVGKRSSEAALRIAVDMVSEGLITTKEALERVPDAPPKNVLDPKHNWEAEVIGLPASPGVAIGRAVYTADRAVKLKKQGVDVILVRKETDPSDIHGIDAAVGVLTRLGGVTSHAAVVARGMGKPAVVGIGTKWRCRAGDQISIDGSTGKVYGGAVPVVKAHLGEQVQAWRESLADDEFRQDTNRLVNGG